jgi:hypothetical protein
MEGEDNGHKTAISYSPLDDGLHAAYLADTREHVDGRTEITDMKDRQDQLDVAVMTDTFNRIFTACQAFPTFLVRSLYYQL